MSGWAKLNWLLLVAVTLVIALNWGLESDPTLIAQAAFFVLGPCSRQTWISAVERAIAVLLAAYCCSTSIQSVRPSC